MLCRLRKKSDGFGVAISALSSSSRTRSGLKSPTGTPLADLTSAGSRSNLSFAANLAARKIRSGSSSNEFLNTNRINRFDRSARPSVGSIIVPSGFIEVVFNRYRGIVLNLEIAMMNAGRTFNAGQGDIARFSLFELPSQKFAAFIRAKLDYAERFADEIALAELRELAHQVVDRHPAYDEIAFLRFRWRACTRRFDGCVFPARKKQVAHRPSHKVHHGFHGWIVAQMQAVQAGEMGA